MKNGFFRGHGLGNDYVVMDPKELSFSLTPSRIATGVLAATGSSRLFRRRKPISA
jgi:diaminopimelate epimerase